MLDDAGIEAVLRATRRIAVVGASSNEGRPSFSVFRYLRQPGLRVRAGQPQRALRPTASRRSATLAEAVAATGPFDMVDVFRRSELCVPHAREAVDGRGALPVAAARRRGLGRPRASPTTAGLSVVMDRCTAIEWRRLWADAADGAWRRRPRVSGSGSPGR